MTSSTTSSSLMTSSTTSSSLMTSFLAGAISGTCSTLLLQPFDLVKTRLQQSKDPRLFTEVVSVLKDGGVRGLWVGVTPSLGRTVPGVGIYFTVFHLLAGNRILNWSDALLVGATSRVTAGGLLIPITVVKTRWEAKGSSYKGLYQALVSITHTEGWRGLGAGLVPTLLRDAPYSALYLMIYSRLKSSIAPRDSAVQMDHVMAALLAGLLATTLVQPADVIKTRMQLSPSSPGLLAATLAIYRNRGFPGFLVGLVPRAVRKSLMSCLSWTVYEGATFKKLTGQTGQGNNRS